MNTKKFVIIALASIALLALLGCVEQKSNIVVGKVCIGAEGAPVPAEIETPISPCCSGLTLIPPKEAGVTEIRGYCTAKCGNGTCDAIESELNCPADCKAAAGPEERVVGPDAYANEQQAFDAIAEEVEGMPELSDAELEALLGE